MAYQRGDFMQFQTQKNYHDEQFIVGKGSIVTNNLCIPLHSIAFLRIEGKKKQNIDKEIIALVIGVILMLIRPLRMFGILVFLFGILSFACIVCVNYLQKCGLVIQLQSGATFTFQHSDPEFIRQVAEVIRKGLDDALGVTYVDMSKTKIVQKINGDPSFFDFGSGNSFGDIVTGQHNEINKDYYDSVDNSNRNISIFNVEQWKKLENYFYMQAERLGPSHDSYKICKRMEQYSKEKDASGLSKFMKTIGKAAFVPIIEKATECGVNELLRTLLTLK